MRHPVKRKSPNWTAERYPGRGTEVIVSGKHPVPCSSFHENVGRNAHPHRDHNEIHRQPPVNATRVQGRFLAFVQWHGLAIVTNRGQSRAHICTLYSFLAVSARRMRLAPRHSAALSIAVAAYLVPLPDEAEARVIVVIDRQDIEVSGAGNLASLAVARDVERLARSLWRDGSNRNSRCTGGSAGETRHMRISLTWRWPGVAVAAAKNAPVCRCSPQAPEPFDRLARQYESAGGLDR